MVGLRLPVLLLALLLILPVAAQARLTLGWVKGTAILGSEDQARRLAAYLESRLAEPVVLRQCTSETQLHEWLHRYRMVDLAPFSQTYFATAPAGQLLPVADLKAGSARGQMVLRQGLRSGQQRQLQALLAHMAQDPAGRDLLTGLGDLRLNPADGGARASFSASSPIPAPPVRPAPVSVLWPDELPAAAPAAEVLALAPANLPAQNPPLKDAPPTEPRTVADTPVPVAPSPPAPVLPEPAETVEPPAPAVAPLAPSAPIPVAATRAPEGASSPPRVAALPPRAPIAPPPAIPAQLPEAAVSRSLDSGRQPLTDAGPMQTIYLVPFTTIMVPLPVAEAIFDRFVEALNQAGSAAGYEFVIFKDDLDRVDPAWLRKATYVTGEIFGYVEESGCCSTDIRSKSRLALYRPGSSEPKLRHEYPAQTFFDHDYSTLGAERQKLAERISRDLSDQLLKALGGG